MASEAEKRIKEEFKRVAQKKPEKYYPVRVLVEHGFKRYRCERCGNYFWAAKERKVCGDARCVGAYQFIGKKIIKPLTFHEVWKLFSGHFEALGYASISRYPVVARWREDIFFVEASIDDFIPYVVEGAAQPPANPLVVPQFCMRFNDVDNVGITGRHYTGFVMMGQHAFEEKRNYKPEEYLEHIYLWLTEVLRIPPEEVQFHEDVWVGSGKMGPSLEFFSHGLELGNQVYMQYDITRGIRELPLKILDMGSGQERYVWFSQGKASSYECVMPSVVRKLFSSTGVRATPLWEEFLPYAAALDLDEVADIDRAWESVSKALGVDVRELKEEIYPLTALFAVAEHTRTLLVALSDGAIPSNVGGGYNLRVILRRCFSFIERFGWNVDLHSIFEEHARYLKPQYPELCLGLENVKKIVDSERRKYEKTKKKWRTILETLKGKKITVEKAIELYDSHGLQPEMLKEELNVEIPPNFFKLVTQRHESKTEERKRELPSVEGVGKTEKLYYSNDKLYEFEARVLKVAGNFVVLDRTAFYPEGGGQECDKGKMISARGEANVLYVCESNGIIFHEVDNPVFEPGESVRCKIDAERRKRLTQHHTATHIINYACRKVLGNHVWQHGACKTPEKAHLDITHYENLTEEEIEKIESVANEAVGRNLRVIVENLSRTEAERRYGFSIYQGGVPIGREIRIISIDDIDHEACGGTHCRTTGEVGKIVVLDWNKIQDGVVRLTFAAGDAAGEIMSEDKKIVETLCGMLHAREDELVSKIEELLERRRKLEKEAERKAKEALHALREELSERFERMGDKRVLIACVKAGAAELKELSRMLSGRDTVIVLFGVNEKVSIFVSAGERARADAREIMKKICALLAGKGGGRREVAQGVCERLEDFERVKREIRSMLGDAA